MLPEISACSRCEMHGLGAFVQIQQKFKSIFGSCFLKNRLTSNCAKYIIKNIEYTCTQYQIAQ
ncbi:hypothetical protein BRYFOR_05713 [Marvinbryantia formatexigens DSM 14469]|uniref:Uncharacterized protein n=1 Tax=Marvinbryantia formatexigens DSM 14469 TaxID=478749 RepID=C6LAR9_9FIRM|nr:hypothetical protein BRYFOR_05713 [Marvinbryantia formatexigens DSM 14469]SDH13286.1 hypothetical protein SAMN05660368_03895 [Marvinbryantia formatexigens]